MRTATLVCLKSAIIASLMALLIAGCQRFGFTTEEYSDNQIVNAIRKAEGTWTYGIKSVKCETEKDLISTIKIMKILLNSSQHIIAQSK